MTATMRLLCLAAFIVSAMAQLFSNGTATATAPAPTGTCLASCNSAEAIRASCESQLHQYGYGSYEYQNCLCLGGTGIAECQACHGYVQADSAFYNEFGRKCGILASNMNCHFGCDYVEYKKNLCDSQFSNRNSSEYNTCFCQDYDIYMSIQDCYYTCNAYPSGDQSFYDHFRYPYICGWWDDNPDNTAGVPTLPAGYSASTTSTVSTTSTTTLPTSCSRICLRAADMATSCSDIADAYGQFGTEYVQCLCSADETNWISACYDCGGYNGFGYPPQEVAIFSEFSTVCPWNTPTPTPTPTTISTPILSSTLNHLSAITTSTTADPTLTSTSLITSTSTTSTSITTSTCTTSGKHWFWPWPWHPRPTEFPPHWPKWTHKLSTVTTTQQHWPTKPPHKPTNPHFFPTPIWRPWWAHH
ncbi:hypothetical protein V1512DRAFT_260308 [Lipomyces arxii]|uniref:uncharacterized protein n=1 Tax=Lipomyces arxii TaxID=56418 RepID=UPI0034CD3466